VQVFEDVPRVFIEQSHKNGKNQSKVRHAQWTCIRPELACRYGVQCFVVLARAQLFNMR